MFNGLLSLHVVIYHGVALDYDFYPILFFVLLFCCTDFYTFVLCFSLLSTSSLTSPCPLCHHSVQHIQLYKWYFYHAIALG
jgi:hypothetical protein